MQEVTTDQRGRSHPPQCTTSNLETGVLEIFNCYIFSYLDYRYQLDNSNSATNDLNVKSPFRQQPNSYGWARESTGVGTRHPFRWGKETHSRNSIRCKQQQGRCKNYSCNLRDRRPPITSKTIPVVFILEKT
ncbi:hypothetical protein TNCV_2872621 [Trichonephila clavipes]|nr:hypothetical protein TNCV_2872621 [Trichonephila clavipes]